MGFLAFLILSFGAFGIICGSKCIPKTAECSRHWVRMEPHKNLMESEHEFNSWCRKQALFYQCLENVLIGKDGNLTELPIRLSLSKNFSDDLCLEGSSSRKMYLDKAACINRLNTEFCSLPGYLDAFIPDDVIPPSRCSLSEKTYSCISATIMSECGFGAGMVFRYLSKISNYGEVVCDVESSVGMPPCKDTKPNYPEREEERSEIFFGLVDRFGVIPEQEDEPNDFPVFPLRTTEFIEDGIDATEFIEDGIDEYVISEAIRNALDSIEDSSSEEYDMPQGDEVKTTERYSEAASQYESYKKNPIITEPFKGLLHYNYSGQEFAVYWRQPNNFPVENVVCDHLLPSYLEGVIFRCLLYHRIRDPDCIASTKYDEQITPRLIRDIDPDVPDDSIIEFGPDPYWMAELNEYKKQKELREQIMPGRFSESKSPEAVDTDSWSQEIPAACTSETRIHDMHNDPDFKWWMCPNAFTDDLRTEIVSVLLPDLTDEDIPLMSAYHSNNIGYVYAYEPRFHEFESVNCSRVNECHPKGRGVFKCSIKSRVIKKCENCYEESRYPSPAFDILRNIKTSPTDSTTEETVPNLMDGSGDAEYETSSEKLVTLLLSEGESPVPEEGDPDMYTEDNGEEHDDELVAIDISAQVPGEPKTEDSSDLRLVFLNRDEKETDDVSDIISDLLYAADVVMNDQGNDAAYGLSSDDEYKLLPENVFVLQDVPPIGHADATYKIIDSQEESDSSKDASEEQ